jgi:hypothetical protein
MKFVVFQCSDSPDYFIVTDDDHVGDAKKGLRPGDGDLKKVGDYAQMGEERVAFDESLAMSSIRKQGYYRFEAPSMAAVPPSPEMP